MTLSADERRVLDCIERRLARTEPGLDAALRAFAPPVQVAPPWRSRVHLLFLAVAGLASAALIWLAVTLPSQACPREDVGRAHASTAVHDVTPAPDGSGAEPRCAER